MIKDFTNLLALVCVLFSFVIVIMLFFFSIPPENKQLIDTIVPLIVGAGLVGIVNFFFGSSKSSNDKNETIKNLSSPENTNEPVV